MQEYYQNIADIRCFADLKSKNIKIKIKMPLHKQGQKLFRNIYNNIVGAVNPATVNIL